MTAAKRPSALLTDAAMTVPTGALRERLLAISTLVHDAEREAERFRAAVSELDRMPRSTDFVSRLSAMATKHES